MELRSQDPYGRYGAPMLRLRDGRYPTTGAETAVTEELRQTLGADLGSTVSLGGARWTVVGLVENPFDLADQFVLVSPDPAEPPEIASVLADAGPSQVALIEEALGDRALVERPPDHPLRCPAGRRVPGRPAAPVWSRRWYWRSE